MDAKSPHAFVQHGATDPLGQQAIQRILQRGDCRSAAYYESAASTNSIALREPHDAKQLPRLIVTDRQSAGRGRLGRQWYSDSGTLTFSLALAADTLRVPPSARSLVALAAGMGVADAAEFCVSPIRPLIKWPNDVYLGDQKIAGLLVEATNEQAGSGQPTQIVIGIGVNVSTDFSAAPQEVQDRATSIAAVAVSELSRYALLPRVVEQVLERITQLNEATPELLAEFRQRCYLTGRVIRVRRPDQTLQGRVLGVDDQGTLELATSQGVHPIHAGEIEVLK
ncbi:biotin--[acetyl-CoA-carboxylase] ligase [Roseimaritima ulvae]|uniref:biotin--[biotin carboxyl-carrier protein] ligase n=1 Tax=Roseimaritima ulvae TaxID=980254 RepID=A0A5B9QTU1_9BACT|nr:biotin--[acetyl-CoA-carboxylase] ligase [Roseimaritima ulvae]QEG41359.1 Bifunctional ligase/repressor BirA [Roseimaritima ulvae]